MGASSSSSSSSSESMAGLESPSTSRTKASNLSGTIVFVRPASKRAVSAKGPSSRSHSKLSNVASLGFASASSFAADKAERMSAKGVSSSSKRTEAVHAGHRKSSKDVGCDTKASSINWEAFLGGQRACTVTDDKGSRAAPHSGSLRRYSAPARRAPTPTGCVRQRCLTLDAPKAGSGGRSQDHVLIAAI